MRPACASVAAVALAHGFNANLVRKWLRGRGLQGAGLQGAMPVEAARGDLPALVLGHWFHRHLILDLHSRKIVGWEVHLGCGVQGLVV
ncbi:hypothetical protein [Variovorax rhizosphaerae]|uniref:Transposase n=1 Tax=Variovorax rhizosphaerae TaxID=1836200 RepID=A0ABU8WQD6_9BURK